MITMRGVTKTYQMGSAYIRALDNVNLDVARDEFIAVMGPSGSGKSTLLYAIGGLLTPSDGEVMVNGESIYKKTARQRAKFRRENIGFVFQTFELIPYLTALENVMLPLYLSGIKSSKQEILAEEALEEVGLAERMLHKPNELSGGEQQRVSIARGIVNAPHILLADEPTGNLDQRTGNEIMHLLKKLNANSELAIIMVTHDAEKARLSSKVLTMIDGHMSKEQLCTLRR